MQVSPESHVLCGSAWTTSAWPVVGGSRDKRKPTSSDLAVNISSHRMCEYYPPFRPRTSRTCGNA